MSLLSRLVNSLKWCVTGVEIIILALAMLAGAVLKGFGISAGEDLYNWSKAKLFAALGSEPSQPDDDEPAG